MIPKKDVQDIIFHALWKKKYSYLCIHNLESQETWEDIDE